MLELVLTALLAAAPGADGHPAEARGAPAAEVRAPEARAEAPTPPVAPTAPRPPRVDHPPAARPGPALPAARKVPEALLAEGCALPPAVTSAALREELRNAAKARKEELAEIARERAGLEKLAAEVATARAALAAETVTLEQRTRAAAAARPEPSTTAAGSQAAEPGRAGAPGPIDPIVKANAEGLAKALKVMKPDDSALLVARLDRPLAVALLRKMKPADAGVVLEKMKPELATELISLMARTGGTP